MNGLYDGEEWAALIEEMGLTPEDTEMSGRNVARYAAPILFQYRKALKEIRDIARVSEGVEFYAMLAQKALDPPEEEKTE